MPLPTTNTIERSIGLPESSRSNLPEISHGTASVADIALSPDLRDTMPRPRRFRRFAVTLPALAWRMTLGPSPSTHDKDLSQLGRAVITDLSLTGLFFITEATFTRKMSLWVRIQINEERVHLPVVVCRITSEVVGQRHHYGYGVRFLRSAETATALPVLAEYIGNQPEVAWAE